MLERLNINKAQHNQPLPKLVDYRTHHSKSVRIETSQHESVAAVVNKQLGEVA